ncbi:hypothetical protein ACSSVW_000966 [Pseudoalteromonas sp. MBR-15]|jgi:hypothetical protein
MERFRAWFIRVTISYLVLFLALFLFYGFCVKSGSWGSFSDVTIAIFTILIAYTTNLLLIAAWLTADNWVRQNEHNNAENLLSSLNRLYFCLHEYRTLQVTAAYQLEIAKNNEPDVSKYSVEGIDAFSRFGINEEYIFYDDQLNFMRTAVAEPIKVTNDKLTQLQGRLEHLKFELMSAAGLFANSLIDNNINLIWEINRLLMAERQLHETAEAIYYKLKSVTKYDGFLLMKVGDPITYSIYKEGVNGK